jgi:hypothetical protein
VPLTSLPQLLQMFGRGTSHKFSPAVDFPKSEDEVDSVLTSLLQSQHSRGSLSSGHLLDDASSPDVPAGNNNGLLHYMDTFGSAPPSREDYAWYYQNQEPRIGEPSSSMLIDRTISYAQPVGKQILLNCKLAYRYTQSSTQYPIVKIPILKWRI